MRRFLVVLALLFAACGDDDDPVASTEETTTSTTEDASPQSTIEAEDPVGTEDGRIACDALPEEGAGDDPAELRSIASEAPQDVAMAIEDVIEAGEAGEPEALDEASQRLTDVCQRYGVDLAG